MLRHAVVHIKSFDESRPVTIAISQSPEADRSVTKTTPNNQSINQPLNKHLFKAQHLDIISFNRYYSWYEYPGELDRIQLNVKNDARKFHEFHNKPVMVTEYGADTYQGYHTVREKILDLFSTSTNVFPAAHFHLVGRISSGNDVQALRGFRRVERGRLFCWRDDLEFC